MLKLAEAVVQGSLKKPVGRGCIHPMSHLLAIERRRPPATMMTCTEKRWGSYGLLDDWTYTREVSPAVLGVSATLSAGH